MKEDRKHGDLLTLETVFPVTWPQSRPAGSLWLHESLCLSVSQTEVNRQHASVTSKTQDVCLLLVLVVTAPKICLQVHQTGGKIQSLVEGCTLVAFSEHQWQPEHMGIIQGSVTSLSC